MGTQIFYVCDECGTEETARVGWIEVYCHSGNVHSYPYDGVKYATLLFCTNCNGTEAIKKTTVQKVKEVFRKKI